jgi:uncharacterized protein (TIGR01777 family)
LRVFMTGATGFIGRRIVTRLRQDGHEIAAWVRSESRGRRILGADVDRVPTAAGPSVLGPALSRCDAVVNLAGEPLLPGRWTARRKRQLVTSRVDLTRGLVQALAGSTARPRVLVSTSASGYYGDGGEEILTEKNPPGADFLAQLCRSWEDAARRAEELGVRVVFLRIGIVLGREGGALAKMLLPFRAGLGGPFGSGRQYMPWIHADDLVAIAVAALTDERYRGPLNATAPAPVTSREFARALGRVLHRPAALPVPSFFLRAVLGEAGQVLLCSQRAVPRRLQELGFVFRFHNLDSALTDIVG